MSKEEWESYKEYLVRIDNSPFKEDSLTLILARLDVIIELLEQSNNRPFVG